jgi:DNA-binding HxlR family transcriptional regulator
VGRSYHQYCPIAHALELIGERWSLLVVRELLDQGPLRYSDLHAHLDGCGTNILAARLKDLEAGGVICKRRLPPPAATSVYELTEYGEELRPVMHLLAHWGARSLGPPSLEGELKPGWLAGALQMAFPPQSPATRIEFRIGDEVAAFEDGDAVPGGSTAPDAVVIGEPADFYCLVVDRDLDAVTVRGSRTAVRALLATLPPAVPRVGAPPATESSPA